MTGNALGFWTRLIAGAALLYTLMATLAGHLGSVRGEDGLIVGAAVLAAALTLDWLLFTRSAHLSWRDLGLGAPRRGGLITATLISALLILTLPLAARLTDTHISWREGWIWLVPGLLAQAGLAEELTFRGFLYGRIRRTREFWRAVFLSIPPFALVHIAMFFTMPAPIAAASLALAVLTCAPLAQLYDLGGRTIWAPALMHAVIQGAIKVIDFDGMLLPLIWIGACACIPYLAFAVRRTD